MRGLGWGLRILPCSSTPPLQHSTLPCPLDSSPVHLLQHGGWVGGRRVAVALGAAPRQLLQRPVVRVRLMVRRTLLRLLQGAQLPPQLLQPCTGLGVCASLRILQLGGGTRGERRGGEKR